MRKIKGVLASVMVLSMVMGNVGLFRAGFHSMGRGTDRARTVILLHDPKPELKSK